MERNTQLTLGSLFDGSGGFPLGGVLAGITPVWASEIEPFPIRVTTKRLPFMKHYGDVSKMEGSKIEPVDIITFGSPCTDLSVAGKRAGIEGRQSGLFFEAIRIIKEMRCATNGKYPRYIVWENVPGAFSSNKGEDFKEVLDAIISIIEPNAKVPMPENGKWAYADCYMGDGWSIAYRVLDAQYWGVPQRRKRIYLVADFGSRGAFDILFKSEGLSGYSKESFSAWQRTAGSLTNCSGEASLCLNDQGGTRMDVTDDITATLRAEAHHPPCVLESAGFCTEHSAKSRSIGYEEELAPTLRAGVVPATIAIENHPSDSRVKISEDNICQTLAANMGKGGGNVPLVLKIRSGCEGGGKGALIQENKSETLSCNNDQTLFEPKAYGICSKDSNSMKSNNPLSGFYEADTSRTIDANGGNPSCNQGGIAVVCIERGDEPAVCVKGKTIVIEGNGSRPSHQGDGYKESDIMYTLNTVDRHAVYAMTTGYYAQVTENQSPTLLSRDYKDAAIVTQPCFGIGRDAFNQGANALYKPCIEEEKQPTLVAKGPGALAQPISFYPQMKAECQTPREGVSNTLVNGTNPGFQNGIVETNYLVRRLTPTECARLQGFPDWWCSSLETEEPSMEDIQYWYDVFETQRKIMGTSNKPKTLKQIVKWLKKPHSDSAEYKMWGNGVALPCVYFVLSGIVWYAQKEAL